MKLTCAQCGAEASAEQRPCGHHDADLIAHLAAKCYGRGGVKVSRLSRLFDALRKLMAK